MVQSIWLQFDKKQNTKKVREQIIEVVKDKYKCAVFKSDKRENSVEFKFLDCNQIKTLINTIPNLEIADSKIGESNFYTTTFEKVVWFIDLEFNYGKFSDYSNISLFQIGRNVWGSVGLYKERLNVLYYLLRDIQKELKKKGIKSRIDLSDCEKNYIRGLKK